MGDPADRPGAPARLEEHAHIDAVGQADWEAVSAGCSLYSSYPWLRAVEDHGDAETRYLAVRSGHRLLGALPVYRFDDTAPPFYDPARLFSLPDWAPVARLTRPLLVGGTRDGYVTEALLRPDLAPVVARQVLGLLVDRFRAMARAAGGWGELLYLTEPTARAMSPLLGRQDQLVTLDARARLRLDGGGFDGYLRGLSRNRRTAIRREIRQFTASGCESSVARLSECHRVLGPLSAQFLRKYGHQMTAEQETRRLAEQAAALDDLSTVLLAAHGGRVVGFALFFRWGDTLYSRSVGFDDELARPAALYFNLVFYRAVEFASERGIRVIDYGCDAFEAKVNRGALLEPLSGMLLDVPSSHGISDLVAASGRTRADELSRLSAATPSGQAAAGLSRGRGRDDGPGGVARFTGTRHGSR